MSTLFRAVVAKTAGVALLGLTACSGGSPERTAGGEATTSAEAAPGLESFDVCNFLAPDDLSAAGVAGPGEPDNNLKSEPGCNYSGTKMDLTLYKVPGTTFEKYTTQGNFAEIEPFEIGGRKAATGVTTGSQGQGICSTFLDAAGGTIIVTVTGEDRDSVDACGESRKVAERVSPRLPE
ncbi:DUF3558 family protein [Saccharopolyspora shandongensis]|uniref:DUF3558 family protein n=1 Tax=Saccharopolyspora shandongensis TaxID=418495 RepID=UPI0033DCB787